MSGTHVSNGHLGDSPPTSGTDQAGIKWQPPRWALWSHGRPVVVYILLVEAAAIVLVAVTAPSASVTPKSLFWLGLLLAGVALHKEASCAIERIREIDREGSPHTNLQSIWFVAALLMLPLPLAAAVTVFSYGYAWLRVYQRRPPLHRKVFSAATIIIASGVAQWVLVLAQPQHRLVTPIIATLDGPLALLVFVAAAILYWLINYALVVGVLIMTNPNNVGTKALGDPTDQVLIGAGACLGFGVALIADIRPWMLPIMLGLVLGLHLGLLVPHYQRVARTDAKTGLASVEFWYSQAQRELARAKGTGTALGVLMIDLDRFKQINDRYGHPCGDDVLKAVASVMKDTVRGYDLIGRLGGEEFGCLLPGATVDTILPAAERLSEAIRRILVTSRANDGSAVTIGNISASIGAAVYPTTATELDHLLLAVDTALYEAKNQGRDQVYLARTGDTSTNR